MNWRDKVCAAWRSARARAFYVRVFLKPDAVVLHGRTVRGTPVSILRAGFVTSRTAYFFSRQVCVEIEREQTLGRIWLWSLPAIARRHGCAFSLFRVTYDRAPWARRLIERANLVTIHLPAWIGLTVDLSDRAKLLRSHSLRRDIAKIQGAGFQSCVSRARADLEVFIQRYHDPHVGRVHGFEAIGLDSMQRLLVSCTEATIPDPWVLVKVEVAGQWVAAMLLMADADGAALMALGVRDGDPQLVKQGALLAAYWLALDYLRGRGYRHANLMHARPFVRNGVLQYKLKFGPAIRVARAGDGFLLCFDRSNAVAREILSNEALLVFKGEHLGALWFALEPTQTAPPRWMHGPRLAFAGIQDLDRVLLASSD